VFFDFVIQVAGRVLAGEEAANPGDENAEGWHRLSFGMTT
jgi:hypothetical protein